MRPRIFLRQCARSLVGSVPSVGFRETEYTTRTRDDDCPSAFPPSLVLPLFAFVLFEGVVSSRLLEGFETFVVFPMQRVPDVLGPVGDDLSDEELEEDEQMFGEGEQHEDLPLVEDAREGGLEVGRHADEGDVGEDGHDAQDLEGQLPDADAGSRRGKGPLVDFDELEAVRPQLEQVVGESPNRGERIDAGKEGNVSVLQK